MNLGKTMFRLYSWLFACFCTAGLLWQLVTIIDDYFKYKVTTSTIIFTPKIIEPTAVTLCFNLFGLLNLTGLKRDLNISVEIDESTDNPNDKDFVNNLTVRQLFDYTPSNNSIIKIIKYKLKYKSSSVVIPKGNLSITKFFRHLNLCYKIHIKNNNESVSYRENSISNFEQFLMTRIILTTFLKNAKTITAIISPVDHIPYQELISTPYITRRLFTLNGTRKAASNYYSSDHMILNRESLPSPYETHCISYKEQGFSSRDHCINDCIASQVWKTFGKVSLMSVVTEPSDSLQLNRITLKDDQIYFNFSKILNNCEWYQCKNDNRHEQRIFTTTRESSQDENRRIRWQHKVSFSQVSFKITPRPSLSFIEIVIFVLGSISTWTGLSIMACNPATLGRLVYKKIKATPQTLEINDRTTNAARLNRLIMEQHRTRQRISQIEKNVNTWLLRLQSSERILK